MAVTTERVLADQTVRNSAASADMASAAVCIVNYNTRDLLRLCLNSVRSQAPDEVVVVDNASTDDSVEVVRAEYPAAVLLKNRNNPGYGAAANQAVANCSSRYVLLLNSDTILEFGALRALTKYLDQNPRAAIGSPRLVNADGTLQRSCFPFPTPVDILLDASNFYRLLRRVPVLREHALRTWSHAHSRAVPWVMGAAMAIRREAFEAVSGFDESFFMYYEEVDLCRRLEDAGWEVHFAPVTNVIHLGGASTSQHSGDMLVQLYVSLVHYYRRHHSAPGLALLIVLVECIALARLARDLVRLSLARDTRRHGLLKMNILAWKRLLLAGWRMPAHHF